MVNVKLHKPKSGFTSRTDISANLPVRGATVIAEKLGLPLSFVSGVLTGKKSPSSNVGKQIIELGTLMAAINVWNNKYCKTIPSIDPLDVLISKNE